MVYNLTVVKPSRNKGNHEWRHIKGPLSEVIAPVLDIGRNPAMPSKWVKPEWTVTLAGNGNGACLKAANMFFR